jgi:glyoxylate/hydroxypyruvate reductase A
MSTIIIDTDVPNFVEFSSAIMKLSADFNVSIKNDSINDDDVEIVIIWQNFFEKIYDYNNLKFILVCGSGVDRVINGLRKDFNIPIFRIVDHVLQDHASDYVVMSILNYTREWGKYVELNKIKKWTWQKIYFKPAIGLMGLGLIGAATARKLLALGFEVNGWVRQNKSRSIENVFVGLDELEDFAKSSQVIVCMLPLTSETKGILNKRFFNYLNEGSYIINIGRGAHVNEQDLLNALDTDHLNGACLDTFEIEPLPENHSFWGHQKITITPHIAGILLPEQQAIQAVNIIRNFYYTNNLMLQVNYDEQY